MSLTDAMVQVERLAIRGYAPEQIKAPLAAKTIAAIVGRVRASDPEAMARAQIREAAARQKALAASRAQDVVYVRDMRDVAPRLIAALEFSEVEPDAMEIVRLVAARDGMTPREFLSSGKGPRSLSDARHEAMFLLVKHTSLSSVAIGEIMRRDHTTIWHGVLAHAGRTGQTAPRGMQPRKPRKAVKG